MGFIAQVPYRNAILIFPTIQRRQKEVHNNKISIGRLYYKLDTVLTMHSTVCWEGGNVVLYFRESRMNCNVTLDFLKIVFR